ncbi:MAG: hypothetical protein HC898_03735 [Phycisphaerales bacterium]|nr:hypothetical protein [Phycisphaerales bacterium]
MNFTLATGTGQATRNSDYALRIAGSNTNLPGNSITFADGVTTWCWK